ncbi:competence/damage-inducible protein cinA [Melghiribacillus thermohalophilus]|uniref:Putative competence-damage inducible protein n=1 Tax=Melghiribacillus thermohalophilus TaxID=1324956 RepID=A0A4R3NGX1_9BACI|nr:competence/damage-inducible protein A [Melghiribacillus thermohalophilus]TCT26698.1 competence/damage-inducible protein cinA [Melghiribacillus thermohalophilus]
MRHLRAEIIAVGTELLLGQILNTNARWISRKLADLGIDVYYHHTVGDNLKRLKHVMNLAKERSNLIVVTGGLGPTDDDLTKEAASAVIPSELYEHEPSLRHIRDFFKNNHIPMTENNRKQALVFKDAVVFPNQEGMAPGMFVESEQAAWIFLPGVPGEMKHLMTDHVIPFLQKHYHVKDYIVSRILRFIGIGEATLENELTDLIKNQTNPTIAPLANEGEVTLRLTAKAHSKKECDTLISRVEKKVMERVGAYLYGTDDDTIEETVFQLLKSQGLTIASAESLTGGRFIESLVSLPGASSVVAGSVVSYGTEIKKEVLLVSDKIIDEFGTVSAECAGEMAKQIQQIMKTDIGISFTGNAGPNPSEGKPVGTVFIGIKIGDQPVQVKELHLFGSRSQIRARTVKKGYEMLFKKLKK